DPDGVLEAAGLIGIRHRVTDICTRMVVIRSRRTDHREVDRASAIPTAAHLVEAESIGDGEEPGGKAEVEIEAGQGREGAKECVLADFVGVVIVAEHAPDEGVQTILVSCDQTMTADRAPLLRGRDQPALLHDVQPSVGGLNGLVHMATRLYDSSSAMVAERGAMAGGRERCPSRLPSLAGES